MSTQPNILVILTDQQTHAALSAHGNPHLHTPHMDSLVHSGLSFLNSYCPALVCGPARGSLLSGRMPHETGVEVNGPDVKPIIPTMGEHFRQAGYRPFYAGKLHLGPKRRKGVQRVGGREGFQFLCDEYPEGIPRQLGSDTDEVWTDHTVEFLRRQEPRETRAEEPFLLVASLHNPHDICYWVMEWRHIVDIPPDSDLPPLPANFQPIEDEPEFIGLCRQRTEYGPEMSWTHGWDETAWRRYLYVYYRLTERVDQQIGRLLAALEGSGIGDETLVVMTSDHGEGVAAHKWVTKLMLWEEVVRVPFVMRLPGKNKIHPIWANGTILWYGKSVVAINNILPGVVNGVYILGLAYRTQFAVIRVLPLFADFTLQVEPISVCGKATRIVGVVGQIF